MIAVGLRHTLALVLTPALAAACDLRPYAARILAALTLLIGTVIAVGQAAYYFGAHLDHFNDEVRAFPSVDAEDALLRSVDFPVVTYVHFVGTQLLSQRDAQQFADFLTAGLVVQVHAPDDITPAYLRSLRRDVPHAFYVEPGQADVLAACSSFRRAADAGIAQSTRAGIKGFAVYYLPSEPDAAHNHTGGAD